MLRVHGDASLDVVRRLGQDACDVDFHYCNCLLSIPSTPLDLLKCVSTVLFSFPTCAKLALEAKYKEELDDAFGIVFNNLFTITNMPIKVTKKSGSTVKCHSFLR